MYLKQATFVILLRYVFSRGTQDCVAVIRCVVKKWDFSWWIFKSTTNDPKEMKGATCN